MGKNYEVIKPDIKPGAKKGVYGRVDVVNEKKVSGWIVDLDSDELPTVELYVNGEKVAETKPTIMREDINSILGKEVVSGFEFRWNEVNLEKTKNLVKKNWEIKVIHSRTKKILSSKTYEIGSDFINIKYIGFVDKIVGLDLYGWVYNKSNPQNRLQVSVYINNEEIVTGVADLPRSDLEQLGLGDGKYGFKVHIPQKYRNKYRNKTVNISVKIKGEDYELKNSPLSVLIADTCGFTIVSNNYFAQAKVLAESYKAVHPNQDFYIILVDYPTDKIPLTLDCGAKVIPLMEIPIPSKDKFIYWYNIMELNTAVKPYVIDFLLNYHGYNKVIYLDPDIYVFKPLEEVEEALERKSIVLTPHITKPYHDNYYPSEVNILQSGVFNLGFIAIKKSSITQKFLDFWKEKLFIDCISAVDKGLFVDQKWCDFIPVMFNDYEIIFHPGYNVAYWNLHERVLYKKNDNWYVNDKPLVFFHFSGFSPLDPDRLSKHQNRFSIEDTKFINELFTFYKNELIKADYEIYSSLEYGFETLPNGTKIPLDLIRDFMQWAVRNKVKVPSPLKKPDEFCKFVMSKGIIPNHENVVGLYYFLLKRRPDVAQAFPKALYNSDDSGFKEWLNVSGKKEIKNLENMFRFENMNQIYDYVKHTFEVLRNRRPDVIEYFKDMWKDSKVFEAFADWLSLYAPKENLPFSSKHTEKIKKAYKNLFSILNLYFLRIDLQKAFPALWKENDREKFINWLKENRYDLGYTLEDISLFEEFLRYNKDYIQKLVLIYGYIEGNNLLPSIYNLNIIKKAKDINLAENVLKDLLLDKLGTINNFLNVFTKKDLESLCEEKFFKKYKIAILNGKENTRFYKDLKSSIEKYKDSNTLYLNLAGFFSAPTSMGESSNSMYRILKSLPFPVKAEKITLPHPKAMGEINTDDILIFGYPDPLADISITVANADTKYLLETFLPKTFWAERNIGYWVWETQELPWKYKSAEELFDEIWTPSAYSAEAIKRTVEKPVYVVPHALDLTTLDNAKVSRKKFNLPEEGILFGFIFDPSSVMERKNVRGLIEAFKRAFSPKEKCYLILKSNGTLGVNYEYENLKLLAEGHNIIFIEETWEKEKVYDLLATMDVYVSLHRAEGFGLTCAEAMALGKPVIATGYSGNLEFMNKDNSVLVPYKLIETERPYGPYPAGTIWAEPDLDFAADAMRKMLDKDFREHLGKKGKEHVRKILAPEYIAKKVEELLRGVRR